MLLLSMATPSIHVAHPHVLISTYHLSADQTFLLELPVCICVVARYVIVSPSSILASRAKWEKSSRLQHAAISGKLVASALYLVRLIVLLGQNEQCWAAQPTAIHSTLVAGDLPSPIQSDCTGWNRTTRPHESGNPLHELRSEVYYLFWKDDTVMMESS